jgi:predicted TIM-barrel fold metal-dependent hydrolase
MFASNFPVDRDLDDGLTAKVIYGHYRDWVSHFSASEKRNLFQNTASRFYRLNE